MIMSLSLTLFRSPASSEDAQPMQRRYSEATLASDYSRSVDNMLKKNFVDWLLGRREKKSQYVKYKSFEHNVYKFKLEPKYYNHKNTYIKKIQNIIY